jgi:3',5'-cyclic-AMP phosphodiesterase
MQKGLADFGRKGQLSANRRPDPVQTVSAATDRRITWVQIGDLHMTAIAVPPFDNYDLVLDQVNALCQSTTVDFVFAAGDNAQNALLEEYVHVQHFLHRLIRPVYTLPGDHDVFTGSLNRYQEYLTPYPYYFLELGAYQPIFLNTSGFPERAPKDFDLDGTQIDWLFSRLEQARRNGRQPLLFMHCYPTELKTTGPILTEAIGRYDVPYVAMGHRHYNQILNDGHTVYTATRSTVQIQEDQGRLGISVTSIDQGVVSWKFFRTGQKGPIVMITSPADHRMMTDPPAPNQTVRGETAIRASVASGSEIVSVKCSLGDRSLEMRPVGRGVWQTALFDLQGLRDGVHAVKVVATDRNGDRGIDGIRMSVHQRPVVHRGDSARNLMDCDVGPWRIKGIPGGHLGPNEEGHEWTKTGLAEVQADRIPAALQRGLRWSR